MARGSGVAGMASSEGQPQRVHVCWVAAACAAAGNAICAHTLPRPAPTTGSFAPTSVTRLKTSELVRATRTRGGKSARGIAPIAFLLRGEVGLAYAAATQHTWTLDDVSHSLETVFTYAGRRLRKQGLQGDSAKAGSRNAAGAIPRVDFRQRVLVATRYHCRFEPRN